jgi:hypothetical protein
VTGVAGAAALLLSVGLLCARRIDTAVWLCALQALSAAVVLAETGTVAAILAFACNGVALPLALSRITSAPALTWRGNAILALSLAVVVPVAGILVFASAGAGGLVAVGASVAMLGLLLIGLSAHALAPAVGLLSAQNGLVMVVSAHPGVSLPAAFAVAVPLVPALVLADHWLRR